jgi:hypothetical protein
MREVKPRPLPPWLRPRDAEELERERQQLRAMEALERIQIRAGRRIRPAPVKEDAT